MRALGLFARVATAARASGKAALGVPALQNVQLRSALSAPSPEATGTNVPQRGASGRPKVVVLGAGWAAARFLKEIDPKLFELTVRSDSFPAPAGRLLHSSTACPSLSHQLGGKCMPLSAIYEFLAGLC